MLIVISGVAGVVLSLLFEYIPGFHQWYNALSNEWKKLIMLGVVTATSLGIFGLSCIDSSLVLQTGITCDSHGAWALVASWIAAITANQGVHRLLPAGPK